MSPEADAEERTRLERAYREYAASSGKRRSWAADNPGNMAIRNGFVTSVFALAGDQIRSARAILDAGCGSGWWLETLEAAAGIRATLDGVDLLADRVKAARHRVPGARIATADIRRLPFEDGRFDVVSLFTVLSSLSGHEDVAQALREATRVLSGAGVLLVWEPRWPSPLNRKTQLVSRRLIRDALPGSRLETRALTLLPPVARRLGSRAGRLYPVLAEVPVLRSHRLFCIRVTAPRS